MKARQAAVRKWAIDLRAVWNNDFYYRIMKWSAGDLDTPVFIKGATEYIFTQQRFLKWEYFSKEIKTMTPKAKVGVEPFIPELFMFVWPIDPQFVRMFVLN